MAKKQGFPYARKISGSGGTVLPVSIPPPASNELRNDFEPYANLAAFPVVGELGLTYLAQDSGKMYYWTGSAYSEMSAGSAETLTSMGTLITSGASKATPIDADEFAIRNSVGGLMAKVTWANIKATLLTYFNTVYLGINAVLTGFVSGAGTVAATDTILQAVQKLDGNVALKATDSLAAHLAGTETITGLKTIDATTGLALPATTGTTPSAGTCVRIESFDNTILDIGAESTRIWLQSTDKNALQNRYALALNPNGGDVEIGHASNAGVLSLKSGHLKFPATANPSADANTLDDYREGTFTPAINFGGGVTGITYTTQEANYTKIGRKVTCNIKIRLSSKGSSTGAFKITGLPFNVYYGNVEANGFSIGVMENITRAGQIVGRANGNATYIYMFDISTSGVATLLNDTNFANDSYIELTVTYFV